MTDRVLLGPEFADALVYAYELHARQVRKGTRIPYVSHLLGVASLVIEAGGSEEEAIATLLHDAAEDQGGEARLAKIERRFGADVAGIVRECSDTTSEGEKERWEDRKAEYQRRVEEEMSEPALRVSLADKLHNATAIARDHREHGDELWTRFNRDKETVASRYRSLVEAYKAGFRRHGADSPHLREFERVVQDVEAAAGVAGPAT
jgi:(p)ppGpp synthase/HD superfamily hydrolase